MTVQVVRETHFPELTLANRGKVRDIYDLGDALLIVTTDRMSAFDVVMDDPIPDKGKVLNKISLFWFETTASIIGNHVITAHPDEYPGSCESYREYLEHRSMLVKKAEPLPVECIVRGYISGSGWREYLDKGSISGVDLPEGLQESSKLPEPIFTPSTKAEGGMHDENIPFDEVARIIGNEAAQEIKRKSLEIYEFGRNMAAKNGIIIADTKFEFGYSNGDLILIDEVLTPDSSRFWPMDEYEPGRPQRSFDKQYLRDYLDKLDWPKKPPPPKLPEDVITITREKYLEALQRITGGAL